MIEDVVLCIQHELNSCKQLASVCQLLEETVINVNVQ